MSGIAEVMDAEKSGDERPSENAGFDEIPLIIKPRLESSPKKVRRYTFVDDIEITLNI